MKHKCLIADEVHSKLDEILQRAGISVVRHDKLTTEQLPSAVEDFNSIVVRSRVKVNVKTVQAARNLKIVARAGAGVDNIDVAACTQKGVLVVNAPGSNSRSVAELTLALILSSVRNVVAACGSMREGKWERSKFHGTELFGKTVGIFGAGKIGMIVADMCQKLGTRVLVNSPSAASDTERKARIESLGMTVVPLEHLLQESDIITVHVPLGPLTKQMINSERIRQMKDKVIIVNTSRGDIVDEGALADALQSGKVGWYCADVFAQEPPPADWVLRKIPNTTFTPHIAAQTAEAQQRAAEDIASQIIDFAAGKFPQFLVNPQVLGK